MVDWPARVSSQLLMTVYLVGTALTTIRPVGRLCERARHQCFWHILGRVQYRMGRARRARLAGFGEPKLLSFAGDQQSRSRWPEH
jgi:hypothetical protein